VDLTQSIRMYGLRKTRNLVVSLRLSAAMGIPLVQWNPKDGGLLGDPAQTLKYANRTADHYGEGSRNQEEAFNAGLVLDVLFVLAEAAGERKSAVRNFMEDRYIHAIKMADKSIGAGKQASKLALERHIATALLMREAGKVVMAIIHGDYLEFRRRFEKKELLSILQHVIELRQYSLSHNLVGALICQAAPGLSDAYQAVLFFDYPYLMGSLVGGADARDLVGVCNADGGSL
jgi:hypothetical protein